VVGKNRVEVQLAGDVVDEGERAMARAAVGGASIM